MSGNGKYTQYAPPANDKNSLLNKLFNSDDAVQKPIVQDLVGKEEDVRKAIVEIAKANLAPMHQTGDMGYFPAGVDLDFTNKSGPPEQRPPDTAEGKDVKWTRPGDPANSYVPDITSPGPGKTDGLDKADDPKIIVKDLKPNYVAASPGTGTKAPIATNAKIVAANLLGVSGKLGDSGGNV
jgi:hypothetical protein